MSYRDTSALAKLYLQEADSAVFRTNDALHIASSHTVQQTDFVTADNRQRTAAAHVGLTVS